MFVTWVTVDGYLVVLVRKIGAYVVGVILDSPLGYLASSVTMVTSVLLQAPLW